MTTLATILDDAHYRIGALAEGQPLPAHDAAVGLRALNGLIDSLPDRGVGDTLRLIRVTGAYTIAKPSILHVIATAALTVTLPENPHDGFRVKIVDVGANFASYNCTIARNGWLIAGAAADVTLSTSGQSKEYMYRADLGDWKDITRPLLGASESPFPPAHDEGVKSMLALLLCEFKGKQPTAELVFAAQDGLARLQAQYMPSLTVDFEQSLYSTPSRVSNP